MKLKWAALVQTDLFEDLEPNPICWTAIYASAFDSQNVSPIPTGAKKRVNEFIKECRGIGIL